MQKLPSNPLPPLERSHLASDLIAGLTFAVVNVPQAMGNALLASVNPVFGLYTLMVATPVGALFTSSVFMNVSTTGAMSVATGDALYFVPNAQKTSALITLVVLIGLIQLALGILKMGGLIRFVSQSVMTGFITGIALSIVLGAVPMVTGYASPHQSKFVRLGDTLVNWYRLDPATTFLGIATIGLIIGLGYTPLRKFAMILALAVITVVSTLMTMGLGIDSLELVGEIVQIPRSLPRPMLPNPSLIPTLLLPAVAISIIGLIQGAGVGQSYPNPDGKYPDVSRDFAGQGISNIVASFFQGIPGGGSMSGTALSVSAGARTRWSNLFAGLFVAAIVLVFVNIVNLIPMAALGGILVVVGFQSIQPKNIELAWHSGTIARTAMLLTLLATLAMPLQFAILAGVAFSILLHVFRSSNRVDVVQFVTVEAGFPLEQPAPSQLPDREITLLYAYGSLFFASASTFENKLPDVDGVRHAVVILLLRGQSEVGATLIGVLQRYAQALLANDGKLMIAGASAGLRDQLTRTGAMAIIGAENVFVEQPQLGAAMNEAIISAQTWLEQVESEQTDDDRTHE